MICNVLDVRKKQVTSEVIDMFIYLNKKLKFESI